ncbi:type II toxin-antitoxin system VapC family toxin [Pseudoduganella guangdongensis]|uniref:type II toxin-antitoxin system VapC family toxin n=1 Tax=Pseudoduganella guangdongensis TaxID=2692179 RepID=UPI00353155E6
MSAVLVDTSVWVGHFRNSNPELISLLTQDRVITHPMIVGEIACGTPPSPRDRTLSDLSLLATSQLAGLRETRELIERESLYGKGCGLIDMVLLASTLMTTGAKLWTMDRRLVNLASRFNIAYLPAAH